MPALRLPRGVPHRSVDAPISRLAQGRSPTRRRPLNQPTPNQQRAIGAGGNVLVVAGAGTGKTRTLVERCLARVCSEANPVSLDHVLMVTFTEAAAAEIRKRLREELEKRAAADADNSWLAEQSALVDTARISTLHSFCLQVVREHFYELG